MTLCTFVMQTLEAWSLSVRKFARIGHAYRDIGTSMNLVANQILQGQIGRCPTRIFSKLHHFLLASFCIFGMPADKLHDGWID